VLLKKIIERVITMNCSTSRRPGASVTLQQHKAGVKREEKLKDTEVPRWKESS